MVSSGGLDDTLAATDAPQGVDARPAFAHADTMAAADAAEVGARPALAHADTMAAEPRAPSPARPGAPLGRGELLGRYVVLDRLGAGGMGVVYAAYDPELDRKVALKLLLPRGGGLGDRADARARLQREAQALARLDHPNVVAIHDVGTLDDRVYLAMEFVEGQTLSEWNAAAPRSWREILAVVVAAGTGLAAAHHKGLVHRDIKPDNIMVGADGRVRVMDFGLARVDDEALVERPALGSGIHRGDDPLGLPLTQAGSVMGTPAYMAPEQFFGAPTDARTDQFSLCATAWEMLYGQRPFAGETLAALAVSVSSGVITPPPARTRVPKWLRRVLERGLQVRAEDRFADTEALLTALRADPTPRRRLIAILAIGLTLVGAGYGVQRTTERRAIAACDAAGAAIDADWNDEARAALTRSFVATGKPFAATVADKTLPWFDRWAASWRRARAEVCRAATVDEVWDDELRARAEDCLDEVRGNFVALARALGDADDTALVQATNAAAGLAPADACTDPALLQQRPMMGADRRAEVLAVRAQLARAASLEAAGHYKEGLVAADEAVAAATATRWPAAIAQAELRAGSLADNAGEYARAEASLHRALAAAREAHAPAILLAACIRLVAVVGVHKALHAEGKVWADSAANLLALLAGDQPLARAELDHFLASVHYHAGAYDEAARLYTRALEVREAALGPDHPDVASTLNNLAAVRETMGANDEAARLYARALALREAALGEAHPILASSLNNLANVRAAAGHDDEAVQLYTRALALLEGSLGADHPTLALTLNNFAVLHASRGDYAAATTLLTRALAIQEATLGEGHPDVAAALNNLAIFRFADRDYDEAARLNARALAIREAALGADHPDVADSLDSLAEIDRIQGDLAAARQRFARARAIREAALGADHPLVSRALEGLGEVELAEGRPDAALPLLERALAIREASGAPADELGRTRFALAQALWSRPAARARARALAEAAAVAYASVDNKDAEATEVTAWIAAHPSR